MKIVLTSDVVVALKDGSVPVIHRAGEELSVYHRIGRRLLYGRHAKWIGREEGDPDWIPVELFRVQEPARDRMMRGYRAK